MRPERLIRAAVFGVGGQKVAVRGAVRERGQPDDISPAGRQEAQNQNRAGEPEHDLHPATPGAARADRARPARVFSGVVIRG